MSGVKIKYIPAQCRLRVEFSKQDCLRSQLPPKQIYDRAKAKLEEEQHNGRIAHFYIDFPNLVKMWRRLAVSWEEPETTVAVTLGAGSPPLKGVHVTQSDKPGEIAELSLRAPVETMRGWKLHFLLITIEQLIRKFGGQDKANPAEVHSLWLRAVAGEKISGSPLMAGPGFPDLDERRNKPYEIIVDPQHKHISLYVYDLISLLDLDLWERLKSDLGQQVRSQSERAKKPYHVLTEDLIMRLRSTLRGPERYGLNMPFIQLIATPLPAVEGAIEEHAEKAEPIDTAQPVRATKDPAKLTQQIVFRVSDDLTEAKIVGLPANLQKNPKAITADLVKKHAEENGIVHGFVANLSELVSNPSELEGQIIAQATPGSAGEKPFLESHVDKVRSNEASVHNRGPRKFVRNGDVVAVVLYGTPPTPGTDVKGGSLPPPPPAERLAVQLGDGIACEDGEHYVATQDGTPVIGTNEIKVVEGYFHEGEVNHATGDIIMSGRVEIQGSVEYGAIVKVKGDLIIGGDINGGHIFCSGNLTVKGGVRSGDSGKVTVHGNINAVFIENAKIFCDGSVFAENSVIASQVYAGGELLVASGTGMLAGGDIRTGLTVKSHSIGQDKGSVTRIRTAQKWRVARRIEILKTRLANINTAQERYKKDVSEIQRKRPEQRSKKMSALLESSRALQKKAKALAEKVTAQLEEIDGTQFTGDDANIFVPGQLSGNVQVMIGEKPIKVTDDSEGVVITGTRRNGTYIHKLSDDKSAA